MPITIRRIEPGDAALLKTTRLAALAESPDAFSRTLDEESALPDDHWERVAIERSGGRDHVTLFAVDDDQSVGLIGGHRIDDQTVELVAMWTDPVARGAGVAAGLIDAIIGWADGATVELWVRRGNGPAERLYERHGFSLVADFVVPESHPCADDVRLRLVHGRR